MDFQKTPALWFVLATVLPLASFLLIFLASGLWCIARRYRNSAGGEALYKLAGGDKPGPTPAYVALGAIGLACVCSVYGMVLFTIDEQKYLHVKHEAEHDIHKYEKEAEDLKKTLPEEMKAIRAELDDPFGAIIAHYHAESQKAEVKDKLNKAEDLLASNEKGWQKQRTEKWKGNLFELVRIRSTTMKDPERGSALEIGYSIDSLSALMFVMVTFIASLIHLFSIGYMSEERQEIVEDHHVPSTDPHDLHGDDHGHGHHAGHKRRGRFGRFFMYLSLFSFSMLNLVLANNFFQVFISWELVGICSFLLIGFYYERKSASDAANKAFITNRIGDAGFIIGLLIIFGYIGTFNFEDVFKRIRSPEKDSHGHMQLAGQIIRANPMPVKPADEVAGEQELKITLPGDKVQGSEAVLFPRTLGGHFHGLGPRAAHGHGGEEGHAPDFEITARSNPSPRDYSSMPYWMLVAAGLGIFLGCVGKSAQFPLQVWLPDAMEGPTPVSALIHAATMVAAGVYLVGRCYPLFTAEVLMTIAYIGGITLFVAATIAIVATDIKKVLAYSTVSQLGYMMLALGVGGWSAGLFHLFTHAFFKALLFLGSGSVIYGCHHEQEMTKMGGLFPKMRITALTMLVGVLAIAGTPFFSGWHSKDAVVAQAFGFAYVNPHHALLFVLPMMTAGITTFYMFRMWFMTFTGKPRDQHVYDHAHESPWQMTLPLVVLAFFAVVVSWGNRPWVASESFLESAIHNSQPVSVMAEYGHVESHHEHFPPGESLAHAKNARHQAHSLHDLAGIIALAMAGLGFSFALATYYWRYLKPEEAKEQFPAVHAFLANKWYFDDVYDVALVRPAIIVARAFRAFDLNRIDGLIHALAAGVVGASKSSGRFDNGVVDYLVNVIGNATYGLGSSLRVLQTGSLRNYVLFLVLAAIGAFAVLTYFVTLATAG